MYRDPPHSLLSGSSKKGLHRNLTTLTCLLAVLLLLARIHQDFPFHYKIKFATLQSLTSLKILTSIFKKHLLNLICPPGKRQLSKQPLSPSHSIIKASTSHAKIHIVFKHVFLLSWTSPSHDPIHPECSKNSLTLYHNIRFKSSGKSPV